MHFSVCKNPDLLKDCPQRRHGHLWLNDQEAEKMFIMFPLTNKQDAKKVVSNLEFLGRVEAKQSLLEKFAREIDASDLPEDVLAEMLLEMSSKKKGSHLKLVK